MWVKLLSDGNFIFVVVVVVLQSLKHFFLYKKWYSSFFLSFENTRVWGRDANK